jgi:Protein of unknown function (DUF2510)
VNPDTSPPPNQPPAGWYSDPSVYGGQRYWDGSAWTDHVAGPAHAAPQPQGAAYYPPQAGYAPRQEKEQEATGTIVAGYVFAVIFPIVGFVIGLTQINRNRHGLWVVLLSVAAFIGWIVLVAVLTASHTCHGPYGEGYAC